MKFILSKPPEEKQLVFDDVVVNQFFVNRDGWLCQKVESDSYLQITDCEGAPYADYYAGEYVNLSIQRILPNVKRIEYWTRFLVIIPSSSEVERLAVNQHVIGSTPILGANYERDFS